MTHEHHGGGPEPEIRGPGEDGWTKFSEAKPFEIGGHRYAIRQRYVVPAFDKPLTRKQRLLYWLGDRIVALGNRLHRIADKDL